jgi:hypothetical protein
VIDIDKLRRLREAGTPGEWSTGSGEHWGRDIRPNVAWCGGEKGQEDAQLIVHSVNAMPEMCTELERAWEELESLREKVRKGDEFRRRVLSVVGAVTNNLPSHPDANESITALNIITETVDTAATETK